MFYILAVILIGISLGYYLREKAIFNSISKYISITICILLFLLGISVGSNKQIIENLPTLGLEALIISLLGVFGSLIAAFFVAKYFFKEK